MATVAHQLSPSFSHKGNPGFSRNRYLAPPIPVDLYMLILTNYDQAYDPLAWGGSDPYGYARSLWVHDHELVSFQSERLDSIGVQWWCDIVHYPFDIRMRFEPPGGETHVDAFWESSRRRLPIGFEGVIHPGILSTRIRVLPVDTYQACEGVGLYQSLWDRRRRREEPGPQLPEPYVGYGTSWGYRGDDPPNIVDTVTWVGPEPIVPFEGQYRYGSFPTAPRAFFGWYRLEDQRCASGDSFESLVDGATRSEYPDEFPESHWTGFSGGAYPVFDGDQYLTDTWRIRETLRLMDDFMTDAFNHITAWHR